MPWGKRISNPSSRWIIIGTTLVLGVASVVLILAPTEVTQWIGAPRSRVMSVLVQLYGAALFGLAMTGWMIRDAVVGGIFGRSYVVGNAGHALVGALTLVRPATEPGASSLLQGITALYWILAVLFGYLLIAATPRA